MVRIGTTEIHIIHPLREDSIPARHLAERGGPFVHHIGVGVESLDEEMERLSKEGMPPLSEPQLTAPGLREVFVKFPNATGLDLQLVEDRREGKVDLIDEGVLDAVKSIRERA